MDQSKRELEYAKYSLAYEAQNYQMRQWRRKRFEDYLTSIADRGYVSMLDVGCGRGQALTIAHRYGFKAVRGVEVIPELCTRPDVTLIEGAHLLPFEDGAFQLVVSTDVMEHIIEEDVQAVLKEMFRVASKAIHLAISHRADHKDKLGHKHITVKPREWWVDQIWKAAAAVMSNPDNCIVITVEADELTPPIKMPCTHLEIRRA